MSYKLHQSSSRFPAQIRRKKQEILNNSGPRTVFPEPKHLINQLNNRKRRTTTLRFLKRDNVSQNYARIQVNILNLILFYLFLFIFIYFLYR